MRNRKARLFVLSFIVFGLLWYPSLLLYASITATPTYNPDGRGNINRFVIPWTSASDGTAGGLIVGAQGTAIPFDGILLQAGLANTGTTPSDGYDVTILDDQGVDVLQGNGANVSNSTLPKRITPTESGGFPIVMIGSHTLSITNAGSAKSGTITLMVRDR